MSERLPYEERDQQFNDLPLPDQDASWQKMKELLDDDDDDIIPPPVFLQSCFGWGILLLVGLTVAWFIIRPEKWRNGNRKANTSSSTKNIKKVETVEKKNTTSVQSNGINGNEITGLPKQNETIHLIKPPAYQKKVTTLPHSNTKVNKNYSRKNEKVPKEKERLQESPHIVDDKIIDKASKNNNPDTPSAILEQPQILKPRDSTKTESITQPNDSATQKKKTAQKKLLLTAGIGEQQQIPIAGQTAVPYSHYGRKGSLSDYVPSVFVQLQKEKKWFVLGEFRYGAPQSVKEFSFNRKTKLDTLTSNISITTMRLKKTYYHQLPFSFNYFVVPNLSVGIGGIYSRFFGAITEKETTNFNTITQTVTNIKQIIPVRHFTDSFLYKTQVHVLLQTDYQWRRFFFGLRYTKDVQPYIKYTKPDGTVNEERNQSLQFIVRYRLWQSGRF